MEKEVKKRTRTRSEYIGNKQGISKTGGGKKNASGRGNEKKEAVVK